jgi:hypothetical protein
MLSEVYDDKLERIMTWKPKEASSSEEGVIKPYKILLESVKKVCKIPRRLGHSWKSSSIMMDLEI